MQNENDVVYIYICDYLYANIHMPMCVYVCIHRYMYSSRVIDFKCLAAIKIESRKRKNSIIILI